MTVAVDLEAQIQLDTKKGPDNVTSTHIEVKADGHTGYTSFRDSELSIGLIEVKGTLLLHSWSLLVKKLVTMHFQVLSQDMAISMQPPAGETDFVLAVLKDVLVDVPSKSSFIIWTED